jgi:glycosyltransferase involved in cell wall biosynthesis
MLGSVSARTCIVVPCFNEAERLNAAAFSAFAHDHEELCFWFVDDGSRDATPVVLESLCRALPARLGFVSLPENVGKAEAVRLGVGRAFAEGYDFVGYWDADLATPLEEISRFIEVLRQRESCFLVLGSRVQLLGREIERKLSRHYLGRVFATVAAAALGLSIYDTQCGAKLFRNTPTVRRAFEEPFVSRWIFDVELLARILQELGSERTREHIVELPLMRWIDVAGSKLTRADFLRAARELYAIVRRYDLPRR